jgi:hypothetical protein
VLPQRGGAVACGLQLKTCMDDRAHSLDVIGQVGAEQARLAVEEARRMYGRTLASWVGDLLTMRRAGLDQPGWAPHGDTDLREAA